MLGVKSRINDIIMYRYNLIFNMSGVYKGWRSGGVIDRPQDNLRRAVYN
jgi:hypothetical protein